MIRMPIPSAIKPTLHTFIATSDVHVEKKLRKPREKILEMAVKYGRKLEKAPELLPSGWAALLCLYNLR